MNNISNVQTANELIDLALILQRNDLNQKAIIIARAAKELGAMGAFEIILNCAINGNIALPQSEIAEINNILGRSKNFGPKISRLITMSDRVARTQDIWSGGNE